MSLQQLTTLAFALHIGGGTIGLISGTIALFARNGILGIVEALQQRLAARREAP